MKTIKGITLITVSLVVFVLSSCEKNYTCECKRVYTKSDGTIVIVPDNIYTYNDSRLKANERCKDRQGDGEDKSGEFTIDCELK